MSQDPNHLLGKHWRPLTAKEVVCIFIAEHIGQDDPSRNLEIELRLGTFQLRPIKRVNVDSVYKTLHFLSLQNPVIVGSTDPKVQQMLNMKSNCYIPDVSHRFNPSVSETFFLSRVQSILEQKRFISEKKEFTIDFFPAKNKDELGRFTFDLENLCFLNTVKEGKHNIDLIHQGLCYRIGSAQEKVTELSKQDFIKSLNLYGVGFGRIKIRRSFRFQFMEFSFTKTFELKDRPRLNEIQYIAKRDVQDDGEALKSICLSFMEKEHVVANHEIELEIVDVPFVRELLKSDYIGFSKVVERFLRNAECLYNYPDEYHMQHYKGLFTEEDSVEFPLYGEYLNTINRK